MTLQTACQEIYDEVEGAIACAFVDLNTGVPLAVYHRVAHFDQDYVDLVSAAAVDMFRGHTVRKVEDRLTEQRQKSAHNSIREVQMITDGTLHFMITLPQHPHIVIILVTTKKTSLGMGWATVRKFVPVVSDLL